MRHGPTHGEMASESAAPSAPSHEWSMSKRDRELGAGANFRVEIGEPTSSCQMQIIWITCVASVRRGVALCPRSQASGRAASGLSFGSSVSRERYFPNLRRSANSLAGAGACAWWRAYPIAPVASDQRA
jgi:hypothetical protein